MQADSQQFADVTENSSAKKTTRDYREGQNGKRGEYS